jgi:hypothetical protein
VKRIQVCSKNGKALFKLEIITEMYEKGGVILKILFLRTMKPEKLNFT